MTSRRIRGVLFDFDGTLTRPGALDFAAIRLEIDCPAGIAILEYLETLSPAERTPLQKILEEKEEEAARASAPNHGAEECLACLKNRGIPFGILTRNSRSSVRIGLERFETVRIEDFAAVITRMDSLPKPHPDGVHQAALRMGMDAAELMVVGDFRFDVIAGKAANACTVLLSNGGESVMLQGDPEPDHTVENLMEILALLDR
jgi:HAD superfamily hydrolase (TIGR01509 family)